MADAKGSALNPRGTPDRAVDQMYVFNGGSSYRSTINNELGITGNPVGHTDSQTLTNKTLTAPTISSPVLSGTVTGTYTLGGTPTFPASVATLTGSQTLTNKTLTSPTINNPTITNASITADAITGFTTSNTGTIYGVAITAGALNGSVITAGTIGSTQLSTSAIKLGYAQITSTFTLASTTNNVYADVTGLSITVTVPTGGRDVLVTFKGTIRSSATTGQGVGVAIVEGSTVLDSMTWDLAVSGDSANGTFAARISAPSAGSHTYKIQIGHTSTATLAVIAGAGTTPSAANSAYILALAI